MRQWFKIKKGLEGYWVKNKSCSFPLPQQCVDPFGMQSPFPVCHVSLSRYRMHW